jgi:hypothetical protein
VLERQKSSRGSLGVLFKSVFRLLYRNAVIVVHGASSRRIVPVPGIVVVVFWRSLELVFGQMFLKARTEQSVPNVTLELSTSDARSSAETTLGFALLRWEQSAHPTFVEALCTEWRNQ